MKPKFEIKISTMDNKNAVVNALFDSGSFYTIIRKNKLPSKKYFYPMSEAFGTAVKEGKVQINAGGTLIIEHEGKKIRTEVLVSPNLKQEMIIGAETMQAWHIDIENKKGNTKVIFNIDMRDPDITTVDSLELIQTPKGFVEAGAELEISLTDAAGYTKDIDDKIQLLKLCKRKENNENVPLPMQTQELENIPSNN